MRRPRGATKNRGPDPAHGSGGFGGLTAVALPRPGHRSPFDSAAVGRAPVRHEGADEESHCRLDRSLLNGGWSPGTRAASAADVWCRRSLRPALGGCQAIYGVVDRARAKVAGPSAARHQASTRLPSARYADYAGHARPMRPRTNAPTAMPPVSNATAMSHGWNSFPGASGQAHHRTWPAAVVPNAIATMVSCGRRTWVMPGPMWSDGSRLETEIGVRWRS